MVISISDLFFANLLASATGAMPERVLLTRTRKKEAPPKNTGNNREISSFFFTHFNSLMLISVYGFLFLSKNKNAKS